MGYIFAPASAARAPWARLARGEGPISISPARRRAGGAAIRGWAPASDPSRARSRCSPARPVAAAFTDLAQPTGAPSSQRRYPYIDRSFPNLERVHEEPPAYIAYGLLSDEECDALIAAAQQGALEHLPYDHAVLLDVHRLWPLVLVVLAGTAFDAWHAAGPDATLAAGAVALLLQTALLAAARWSAGVAGLVGAVWLATRHVIGGQVFTGTKWTVAHLFDSSSSSSASSTGSSRDASAGGGAEVATTAAAAAQAAKHFLCRASRLLHMPPSHMEPPTVSRYLQGQQQRVHYDGRPAGDPSGYREFMAAGGQRLVVCYLKTLSPSEGGATCFHHPSMHGLLHPIPSSIHPSTCHSGLPVISGEKWIVNSWACQRPVPSAVELAPEEAAALLDAQ
eukprot:scaffold17.g520.t1